MSGRVCLLCEKPLGRVWLGAGEDFCSREHRNQYRLRRGMDRLLEANKVASLMRRRENPKPITVFRPIDEAAIERHGFFDMQFQLQDAAPMAPPSWNATAAVATTMGLPSTDHLLETSPALELPVPERMPADGPKLGQRSGLAALPSSPKQPYPRVKAAPPADPDGLASPGSPRKRDAGVIWKSSLLLHLDPDHHLDTPSFHPYKEPHGWSKPDLTGPRGYSLRVSMGSGFRIQSARLRSLKTKAPQTATPQASGRLETPPDARSGRLAPRSVAGPPTVRPLPAIPKLHWADPETRLEWPGIISPVGDRVYEGPELELRPMPGAFTGFPPAFPPPSRHGGRDRARLRRLRVAASGDPPEPIVARVSIGCAVDGVEARPGAPHEARNSVEERFDDGWKNWSGGFASWTIDAAGARTGNLALFTPSMDWRDYELEFFTRIENQSVSWVYRALSLNDYYMASITALPGKGYAFSRRTVLRGKPGAALTSAFSILPNPKSAYLIRLRIAGNQFSLSIDGQRIETWTDNRFSTGGAGFLGATDDRARIYWVRFYPGPGKESQRR